MIDAAWTRLRSYNIRVPKSIEAHEGKKPLCAADLARPECTRTIIGKHIPRLCLRAPEAVLQRTAVNIACPGNEAGLSGRPTTSSTPRQALDTVFVTAAELQLRIMSRAATAA